LLNAHKVEYLLIGGYAVGYHGYPRATADMDIWVAVHAANAQRTVGALREFGFDLPDLSPGLFLREWRIVRLLKHLKLNKKASGRHQDLADLEHLP